MNIQLVPLADRPDLVSTLAGWFCEAWPQRFAGEDAAVEHLEGQMRKDGLPIALVALVDEEPAGTVALTEQSPEGTEARGPRVDGLHLHRAEEGLDQLLVMTACRLAWGFGHDTVYAATDEVEPFEAVGFSKLEEGPVTILEMKRPPEPPSYYEQVGGEEVVRALVDRFYDLMDSLPDAADIRAMHARSLKSSRQKLFEFLSGWMGGPNLYVEKRGHPRLRMRHMPFPIGTEARDQWLMCMDQALDEIIEDEQIRQQLSDSFARIADHMRNRRGP
jgi:hemoglobin